MQFAEQPITLLSQFSNFVRPFMGKNKVEAEERLQLATEASRLGIWEIDLKTHQCFTNIFHDQAFGYSKEIKNWTFQKFSEHLHPEDRERVISQIKGAIAQKSSFDLETRVLWPDGSRHWMSMTGKVARETNRLVGVNQNITEKKLAEETLREALFYRDEFLSIASHELKTPLTSLKLQCQIFKRVVKRDGEEGYSKERVDRLVEQSDQHVNRLVRLVDDMLDISRIRTGKLSFTFEKAEICQLVDSVIERMKPQFDSSYSGRPVIFRCDRGELKVDRMRIEQVICNLLNNALKYGRGLPIEVKIERCEDVFRISIKDNGIGILPKNHGKIFSRFQRAIPASEVSGLGLGLYIAQQIVDGHNGRIHLVSDLDQGSTFIVELPAN
jgi:PAS domain S-box-containing protein